MIFTPPPTQLRFQSGPISSVTPQVETPTGASQNNENVAGQQTNNANTGIVAGVESLPSTSTAPQLPLLGLAFAAAGGLMLRRRRTITPINKVASARDPRPSSLRGREPFGAPSLSLRRAI